MKSLFLALFLTLFSSALLQRPPFPPPPEGAPPPSGPAGSPPPLPPEAFDPLMNSTHDWLSSQGMVEKLLFRVPPFTDYVNCIVTQAASHPSPCINGFIVNEGVFPDTPKGLEDYYSVTLSNVTAFCAEDCRESYNKDMTEIKNTCSQKIKEFSKTHHPPGADLELFANIMDVISQGSLKIFKQTTCVRVNPVTKALCASEFFEFLKKRSLLTKPPRINFPDLKQYMFGLGGLRAIYDSVSTNQGFSTISNSDLCTSCNLKWLQLSETFFAEHIIPFDEKIRIDLVRDRLEFNKQFVAKVNSFCPSSSFKNALINYDMSKLPPPGTSQLQQAGSLTSSATSSYSLAWTVAAISFGSIVLFAWAKMK